MGAMVSHITGASVVYSIVYSGSDQRKHQSSASLAFVWGIHLWPVNSPHKGPATRKMFPFNDVIMSVLKWCIMYFGIWRVYTAGFSTQRLRLCRYGWYMVTSSNGNRFRVNSPLWGQSTGHMWIPLAKASDAELWYFLWSALEQKFGQTMRRRWFEKPSRSLWRQCNVDYLSSNHLHGIC